MLDAANAIILGVDHAFAELGQWVAKRAVWVTICEADMPANLPAA